MDRTLILFRRGYRSQATFYLCLLGILYSQPLFGQHPGYVRDSTFNQSWQNKASYQSSQEYIRNLDFSLLNDTTFSGAANRLLKNLQKIVLRQDNDLFDYVRQSIDKTQNQMLRTVYSTMLAKLLCNDQQYVKSAETLNQFTGSTFKAFARLPAKQLIRSKLTSGLKSIQKTKFGQFSIELLGNNQHFYGWFDTGAESTIVSESMAKKLGIQRHVGDSVLVRSAANKNFYAQVSFIDSLQIGNVILNNHPLLIFKDDLLSVGVDSLKTDIGFILGWTAISQLKIKLDTKQMTYTSELSPKTRIKNPNLFWLGAPGLRLTAENGQSLIFFLDTGNDRTELGLNIKSKIEFDSLTSSTTLMASAGGYEKVIHEVVPKFSFYLSGYKIRMQDLAITGRKEFYFIFQDGIIGADILGGNIITIDYPSGQFSIDR